MRVFAAVAREGSFSRAGKRLLRSQSAVSIQVAKLEDVIGQRLLDRTTKSVELTEAGTILLGYLEQTEALLEQAGRELEDLTQGGRGRLSICTSDTTGCYRLPTILQAYHEKYPAIEIEIRNAPSPGTIQAVLEREVDLGIATLRNLPPSLDSIPLFTRRDVLICHPEHRLAKRKRVLLKDLEGDPFILLDRNCSSRRLLDARCEEARVTLQIAMELSSIEVIKRFVRIDAGLSVVPAVAIAEEVEAGSLVSIELRGDPGSRAVQMGVVFRRGRYLSLAARAFVNELKRLSA